MAKWRLKQDGLISDFATGSPVARAFVALFEQLCLLIEDETHPLIVVTSPGRGEGRSTVAANLALCTSSVGRRNTLLIDADSTNPALASRIGVKATRDLSDVLGGGVEWNSATNAAVSGTLSLVPGAASLAASMAAVDADRLKELIRAWRAEYNWIVVDTPPLLNSATALVLGRHATGAILVVEAGKTRSEVIAQASQKMREHNVRPLGVVLNRRRFVIPRYAYRSL